MDSNISVLSRLCSDIHFFEAEKRIANHILSNIESSASMTLAELAHASGTSEATVSRFCKKLGFDNYRSFQLSLARDVLEERRPGRISDEISLDNMQQSLQNILANKVGELMATFQSLDEDTLRTVLELMRSAQLIQVAAVGNTVPVAMDAAFKLNQLGLRAVTSEVWEKSSALAMTLTLADLILMISNSGKSRRLQEIARVCRENGTPIVVITSDATSPLAKIADHVLISTNREALLTTREFAFSRISSIAIVEVLYHFLLVSLPNARAQIHRHEAVMRPDKTLPV